MSFWQKEEFGTASNLKQPHTGQNYICFSLNFLEHDYISFQITRMPGDFHKVGAEVSGLSYHIRNDACSGSQAILANC